MDDPVSNEYNMQFQQLSTRVGELKHEVNGLLASVTRSPENMQMMRNMIHTCKALDKEIVMWLKQLPEQYKWKTVAWEAYNPKCDYSKAEVFPGRIDTYGDLWVVNFWNVMRCMRIVLASLIIRLTAWVNFPADYRTTPEYASTARTVVEAITDIIASVPYQMGLFDRRKDLKGSSTHSVFGCGEDTSEKGLAGYFLLWPLTCIQGQDYLTDSQRIWVKGRLKAVGSALGVRYGNMLSQVWIRRDRQAGSATLSCVLADFLFFPSSFPLWAAQRSRTVDAHSSRPAEEQSTQPTGRRGGHAGRQSSEQCRAADPWHAARGTWRHDACRNDDAGDDGLIGRSVGEARGDAQKGGTTSDAGTHDQCCREIEQL